MARHVRTCAQRQASRPLFAIHVMLSATVCGACWPVAAAQAQSQARTQAQAQAQNRPRSQIEVQDRPQAQASISATLPTISVSAGLADTEILHPHSTLDSGALGRRSVLDTPFSSTVVTAADLRDRQVRKLGDVFALDASVTDNSAAYGVWGSYLTVRAAA